MNSCPPAPHLSAYIAVNMAEASTANVRSLPVHLSGLTKVCFSPDGLYVLHAQIWGSDTDPQDNLYRRNGLPGQDT